MYQITEEYLTGIELIDEEHTHLFELAESAYQLLQEEFLHDKYDQLSDIFRELQDYTEKHFSDEEEYMKSIDYPALFIQRAQHKQFVQKLEEINEAGFEEEQDGKIQEILTFLTDWLYNHILKMDKLIAE
ncbi:bacteriohemerythrin [bacterium C-53]|nr:bacteriohemerythrin [Lachnospiraceae bacterium]NBI04678.1 bacteriohemerythrin [Lachnospiraceae bacterium]RKJ07901.1 bacteriohemerythrin [bacterium C-53]